MSRNIALRILYIALMAALDALRKMLGVLLLVVCLIFVGRFLGLSIGSQMAVLLVVIFLYYFRSLTPGRNVLTKVLATLGYATATLALVLLLPGLLIERGMSSVPAFATGYVAMVALSLFRGRPRGKASDDSSGTSRGWFDDHGSDGSGGDDFDVGD